MGFMADISCPYPPITKRAGKCAGDPYGGDTSISTFEAYVDKLLYWAGYAQLSYEYAKNPPNPLPPGLTLKTPRKDRYSPEYYVLDTEERLIIGIKGTSTVADAIADLAIAKNIKEIRGGIVVHSAMLKAAETLLEHDGLLEKHILPAIAAGRKIRACGHSLGGGVLIYLVLLLIADPRVDMKSADFHGYAFAPPSVLPRCSSDDVAPYITCIVNGGDTVARLPPLRNLILPGGSQIIHIVECNNKMQLFLRDWSYFEQDRLGLDTNRKDHYLKNYIKGLERIKEQTIDNTTVENVM